MSSFHLINDSSLDGELLHDTNAVLREAGDVAAGVQPCRTALAEVSAAGGGWAVLVGQGRDVKVGSLEDEVSEVSEEVTTWVSSVNKVVSGTVVGV